MKTRRKNTPDEYRSSVLEILGLSSPADNAATTKVVPPARSIPTFDDLEAPVGAPSSPTGVTPVDDGPREDVGLVERLWTATEASDDLGLDDWAPETPVDRAIGRYRWAWWPVLIGILLLGVLLVVSTLRGIPAGQAADLRLEWIGDIGELEADIPAAASASEIITAASPDADQLSIARASLIGFSTSGATIDASISQSFPSPPPFASASVFEELRPIQTDLQRAVDLTQAIDDALADALTYRDLVNQSFRLPALPIVGDELTITDLGQQIASTLSFSRDSAQQLPVGPEYSQHRASVEILVNRLEDWQASYLDALRLGDIDAATNLQIEMNDRVSQVRATLRNPLAAVGVSVDTQLAELTQLLASSRTALAAG